MSRFGRGREGGQAATRHVPRPGRSARSWRSRGRLAGDERDYATQSATLRALASRTTRTGWYDPASRRCTSGRADAVAAGSGGRGSANHGRRSRDRLKQAVPHPLLHGRATARRITTCMPYYGLLAALYGDGRPVRLANDRSRAVPGGPQAPSVQHALPAAVDRRSGLLQSFQATSSQRRRPGELLVALTMVGDLGGVDLLLSRRPTWRRPPWPRARSIAARRAATARWQTMAATELMIDEIAGALGLDSDRVPARATY